MFSWQARIKTLVTIAINTFLFICASILIAFLSHSILPTSLYVVTIILVMLQQYIINKEINVLSGQLATGVYIIVPFIITIIIDRSLNLSGGSFLNYIYFIAAYINGYFFASTNIDYEYYKSIYNFSIGVIIAVSIIAIIFCSNLSNLLVGYYVLFFLLMIISLRESRTFTFNMVNKESRRINTVLTVISCVIFLSITSEKVRRITSFVITKLIDLFLWIVMKISMVLAIPLKWFTEYMQGLKGDYSTGNGGLKPVDFPYEEQLKGPNLNPIDSPIVKAIAIMIFIAIVAIIIWQCIKIRRKMLLNSAGKNTGFREEREVIIPSKKKKKFMKSIIKRDSTVKEKICHVFGKFQKLTKKKGVFEEYMTATQISNVSKIYVESTEELDIMSKIYNEAKFSNHTMTENELNAIKDSLNIINKEYKVK